MILLQASICASAGVVSDVQSGPRWLCDWASGGSDRNAASASANITIKRSIDQVPIADQSALVVQRPSRVQSGIAAPSGHAALFAVDAEHRGLPLGQADRRAVELDD